jgi:hypothetical protein
MPEERWKRVIGGGHTLTLERVNPTLTYHESRIRKGGARGLNTPTREAASCDGC